MRGERLACGLNVSPGAAVGQIAFDADTAERWAKAEHKDVILVRPETKPDDVHGMLAARGILTSRGGRTSHAALVARQFGKPAVVGCSAMEVDLERRQLTVLCCDVVDAPTLAGQLDPEDCRDVMGRYHATCTTVITRYGGHIAHYLGDGLLGYFGWPQAHEDDARRAVHAGVALVMAVRDLSALSIAETIARSSASDSFSTPSLAIRRSISACSNLAGHEASGSDSAGASAISAMQPASWATSQWIASGWRPKA